MKREQHELLWRPFNTPNPDGINQLQIDFEEHLRHRVGPTVQVDREIEHDCDGKNVLWLTIQPHGLEIVIGEGSIQIGGRHFFDEWDSTPRELIESASEKAVSIIRGSPKL